jgi:hypothetical protein
MGAGSAGEVTRTHPASILPYKNDVTAPVMGYGFPCFFNGAANDVRGVAAGDASATAVQLAGFVARPYPHQSGSAVTPLSTVGYGGGSPDIGNIVDVLQTGSIWSRPMARPISVRRSTFGPPRPPRRTSRAGPRPLLRLATRCWWRVPTSMGRPTAPVSAKSSSATPNNR